MAEEAYRDYLSMITQQLEFRKVYIHFTAMYKRDSPPGFYPELSTNGDTVQLKARLWIRRGCWAGSKESRNIR